MFPHAGVGGWTPNPKKLTDASAMIYVAICKDAKMIIGVNKFGRICLTSMPTLETPVATQAVINSFSRKARTSSSKSFP